MQNADKEKRLQVATQLLTGILANRQYDPPRRAKKLYMIADALAFADELIKRGISHEELAIRLQEYGILETKSSIDSKISRGTFSATFLIQSLHVIGCKSFAIENQLLMAAEPYIEYKKA